MAGTVSCVCLVLSGVILKLSLLYLGNNYLCVKSSVLIEEFVQSHMSTGTVQ